MPAHEATAAARTDLLAHGDALAAAEPGFGAFYRKTVTHIDPADLGALTPEGLEAILRHSHGLLGARGPGEHTIRIWLPEESGRHTRQIIDVLCEDMPFIVDSVLAAIRAAGGQILLFAHPVLNVDTSTRPWTVLGEPVEGARRESFLHVEIAPITDEEKLSALYEAIDEVMVQVRRTVRGWRPMLERLRVLVQAYRTTPPPVAAPVLAECLQFLAWLADHNFTFLGMREYRLEADETGTPVLAAVASSGLGILEDPDFKFMRHGPDYVDMTSEHVAFLKQADPLLVTKANARARVHRHGHMDYVGVKLYADDGSLAGELRILGLFTSQALATPNTEVPLIRRKISEVMKRSGLDPRSHAGKGLMAALDTYPRDELFQIAPDQLYEFASIVASLADRPRVRVLPRIDPFDNFVTVLLYMPRDHYTSDRRAEIGRYLATVYEGRVSAYYPHFPEGDVVRVYFILGRNGGKTPTPDRAELEAEVARMCLSFGERLSALGADSGLVNAYREAFSTAYQSVYSPQDALDDIAELASLEDEQAIAARLGARTGAEGEAMGFSLKLYHFGDPIPLSRRVPVLEDFGFAVIDERTYTITPTDGRSRHLHDMLIMPRGNRPVDLHQIAPIIEGAIEAIWAGEIESDGFNQLCLVAAMGYGDVTILRALGRYLKQIGSSYSQHYLWTALAAHPLVASALVALFHALHDPDYQGDRDAAAVGARDTIVAALSEISSLDEDQIIRRFLNLIEASLRTNAYQRDADGGPKPALAIKFDSRAIEGLPSPKPYREITVYAPRVEGIHLRGGPIARGGIRWSDRPEDFRTEVLGLVKAQMVKNAVIVPVGAKGGFVPKQMPTGADRDAVFAEGTECYKIFIGALLDVTDNLDGDNVIPPERVVRRDGNDPYLVVAADKGTASFSDTANAIATARGFWLGDAFASGGSAGYDHKKMAITARGGWEAVKRHFREMDRDIQEMPFTAVGVGDMSGDVFGNGMLLSQHTRLIAAFDHRDIFIDPNPNPETSYAERRRLFEMGRSSWQNYDRGAMSSGGAIIPRSAKSATLSAEAQAALGLSGDSFTPVEIMRAILKADVDLLWFGGIGTYVRAPGETNADVGDKANDAIRISGTEVRAKVIGEGANLGVTQRGRVAYALNGGRINTDAIDNSAGVNSSDLEVNIKIALGTLVRAGAMSIDERNGFLVEMTGEVAELCLRNNYLQTLALSLSERRGAAEFPDHVALMQQLESEGHLDRGVELLPDDAALAERAAGGKALTRPEIAVLLAYAKNVMNAELVDSQVPDDPYLGKELFRYFPALLAERHGQTIETHRLRREVIATVLSNAMINRGGPAFVSRLTGATSAGPADVAAAYAVARDAYDLTALNAAIDAMDAKMSGGTQLALYGEVQTLLNGQTLWFLRNEDFTAGLTPLVERYRSGVAEVRARLDTLLPAFIAKSVDDQAAGFVSGGAEPALARRIAELSALTLASDVVLVAQKADVTVDLAAGAYFAVLERFNLGRITEQGGLIALSDPFDRMALDRALANLMRAQRDLTIDVLAAGSGSIDDRMTAWHDPRAVAIDRNVKMVADLTEGDLTVSRLSVAAGLLSDLATS